MDTLMKQALIFQNILNIQENQDNLPWQPFTDEIDIYRLYGDNKMGAAAALLRYQPGASVALHKHTGYEHIFILSGSQTDDNGEHQAGTLVINPPNSKHSVVSKDGCIVLVIWEKAISALSYTNSIQE